MFWGCTLEGNKTHTQLVEDTYQIGQAALEPNSKKQSSSPDIVSIWVKSEEGDEYLLCTLEHGKTWQVPVTLLAMEGSEMAYLVKGDGRVHLTGNLVPDDDDFDGMNEFGDEELSDEEDEELDTSNGEIDARNVLNGKRAALALPPSGSPAKKMKNEGGKAVAKAAEPTSKKGQANGAVKQVNDDDEDDEDDESDEEADNALSKLLSGTDDFDDEEDDEDMDDDEDEEDEEIEKAGKKQQQQKNNLSKNTAGQQQLPKGKQIQIKQENNITPKQHKQNKFAGGDQKKPTPGPGKNQHQGNRSFGGNNSNQKGGFNKQGGGGQQKGGSPFGSNNKARNKFPNKGGKWSGGKKF